MGVERNLAGSAVDHLGLAATGGDLVDGCEKEMINVLCRPALRKAFS
jgi:hypothetical protein